MVNTADFYKHTDVECDRSEPIVEKIMPLLDEVVGRLPDEEQFKITGLIVIHREETAMRFPAGRMFMREVLTMDQLSNQVIG